MFDQGWIEMICVLLLNVSISPSLMSQHNTCTQTEVWYPISFLGVVWKFKNFWIFFFTIFLDMVVDQYLFL